MKYLDNKGLSLLWNKIKETFANKTDVNKLKDSVYNLGNFNRIKDVSLVAQKVGIADDPNKTILVATINDSNGVGTNVTIINNVFKVDNKTLQTAYFQRDTWVRTITLNSKLDDDHYDVNNSWWSSNAYNIKVTSNDTVNSLQLISWKNNNIGFPVTLNQATITQAGLMTAADKIKLDSLSSSDAVFNISNEIVTNASGEHEMTFGEFFKSFTNGNVEGYDITVDEESYTFTTSDLKFKTTTFNNKNILATEIFVLIGGYIDGLGNVYNGDLTIPSFLINYKISLLIGTDGSCSFTMNVPNNGSSTIHVQGNAPLENVIAHTDTPAKKGDIVINTVVDVSDQWKTYIGKATEDFKSSSDTNDYEGNIACIAGINGNSFHTASQTSEGLMSVKDKQTLDEVAIINDFQIFVEPINIDGTNCFRVWTNVEIGDTYKLRLFRKAKKHRQTSKLHRDDENNGYRLSSRTGWSRCIDQYLTASEFNDNTHQLHSSISRKLKYSYLITPDDIALTLLRYSCIEFKPKIDEDNNGDIVFFYKDIKFSNNIKYNIQASNGKIMTDVNNIYYHFKLGIGIETNNDDYIYGRILSDIIPVQGTLFVSNNKLNSGDKIDVIVNGSLNEECIFDNLTLTFRN